MNWDFIKPILAQALRDLLRTVGAAALAHGLLQNGAGVEAFVGAGMTLGGLFWGWFTTKGYLQVISAIKRVTAKEDVQAAVKTANAAPPGAAVNGLMLLIGAGLLLAMISGSAHAQVVKKPLTGNIAKDFNFPAPASPFVAAAPAAPADLLGDLMGQIEKIKADTVANVIADINAADADAASLTNPADPASFKDPISHACYPAAVKFLQSLPTSTAPTGTFVGVQLFQKKRDFLAQLQAGLPVYLKLGCAPLLGDEVQSFVKLMAMVGVKVLPVAATALMPALAPITLPALALTP